MDVRTCVPGATLKMQSVKASLDAAPVGPVKAAALKHYQAAEVAHLAKEEAVCNNELDIAKHMVLQLANREKTPRRKGLPNAPVTSKAARSGQDTQYRIPPIPQGRRNRQKSPAHFER